MSEFGKKMCLVARQVGVVQKDAVNSFHRYRYATAASLLAKIQGAMAEHGLWVESTYSEFVSFDGATAIVRKTIRVTDGTGTAEASAHGQGQDKGDKAFAKAETAAAKYAWAALFAVAWVDDDPEADPETDRSAKPQRKPLNTVKTTQEHEGTEELRQIVIDHKGGANDGVKRFRAWQEKYPALFDDSGAVVPEATNQIKTAVRQTRALLGIRS